MVTDTPPVKSMSKIVLPRTMNIAAKPMTITSVEPATAIRRLADEVKLRRANEPHHVQYLDPAATLGNIEHDA